MIVVLNKALQLRPSSAEANYILGMYYTNRALLTDQQLNKMKGTSPEDVKKKKEFQDIINEHTAKSVTYLEATGSLYNAKPTLKPAEKEHYKTALQQLINLYRYLANPDKVKATEEVLCPVESLLLA